MKKKKILKTLIATALATLVSLTMIGCGGDKVNKNGTESTGQRFIDTKDEYDPGNSSHNIHVFYDAKTKIVYLITDGQGGGICPMLNEQKQPMTIDEYNKTK